MTRCPNCTGENADTQHFCGDCGTPLPVNLRQTATFPKIDETIRLPSAELAPGLLFAKRYQVIEELGMGGMGRVYRVLDNKLSEEIGLKLVRPDIASDRAVIERFSAELKLARQVVHRNVARMFDLNEEAGVPYITMEYVKGENLKRLIRKVGHLSPSQALPYACQICEGLAEAHRLGIVHRDLKPQNVMIDEEGQAKILDFGLARLLDQAGQDGGSSRSGTPAYISPEQIRGTAADARSDIYSLGVLIYEMLTGHTPFKADRVEKIVDMHLHDIPEALHALNPRISNELSTLVMKCLEKDPTARYQSAEELGRALGCLTDAPRSKRARRIRRALLVGAGAAVLAAVAVIVFVIIPREPWRPWLAVLPVDDNGLKPANKIVLDGLQEAVTDRLNGIPSLRVLPVPSVDSIDVKGKPVPQIGEALGVRYLVRLRAAIEGENINAVIYLIDAKKNRTFPELNYNGSLTDYRARMDEIALHTAKALSVDISPGHLENVGRRGTDRLEAYSSYLEGTKIFEEMPDLAGLKLAIGKFQRAIEIDPNYALAHWGLGNAYENLYFEEHSKKDPAVLDKMYEHFTRASDLDPSFAETNLGLGWYHFNKGDNWRAFDSFRKALTREPDGYIVNRDAGAFLMSIGLYKQAIRYFKRAVQISPRDPLPLAQIAQCWYFLGRCERALTFTRKALDIKSDSPVVCAMHIGLLTLLGHLDEADKQIADFERIDPENDRIPFFRDSVSAMRTSPGKPRAFGSGKPKPTPPGTYLYLAFGMKEEALANIKAGIDRGFENGMYFNSYPSLVKNPWYGVLRDDPRFQAILRQQKELYEKKLKTFEKL